jgi:hypothetical protein
VDTPTTKQQYGGNIDLRELEEWVVGNVKAVVKSHPLKVAAAATGGTFQPVVKDPSLEKAVDAIGGELNSQYILSYRPTGSDAGYHRIEVTVDSGTSDASKTQSGLIGSWSSLLRSRQTSKPKDDSCRDSQVVLGAVAKASHQILGLNETPVDFLG